MGWTRIDATDCKTHPPIGEEVVVAIVEEQNTIQQIMYMVDNCTTTNFYGGSPVIFEYDTLRHGDNRVTIRISKHQCNAYWRKLDEEPPILQRERKQ